MSTKHDEEKDFTPSSLSGAALRRRAEEKARATGTRDLSSLSPEETARLLHELQVHQIELEMQNEELRRSQEELEASRARYFDLYDLAPAGYVTLSEHSSILEGNLTAATLLGLPKSSMTKTPLTRYILPDDQDTFYRHRKRLFETGEPQVFEIRVMRSDGVRLWVRMEAHAAQDGENGQPISRAVMINVTERKLLENARLFLAEGAWMRTGEDFFESLARYLGESLGMDYVCIDRLEGERLSARTLAVYFDGKFEDNVTYSLQDTPCGEVVKKDICSFPKGVRHLFPNDRVLQEMKAESYVGSILRGSKGQPIGLIAVIGRQPLADQHMTESILRLVGVRASGELERKLTEEALRESEERFHRLFEDDLTGNFFCSLEGRILECNPSFAAIFGFSSRDDAVGTSMLDLYIDPGERESILQALRQEGKLGRYEAWRKRRDGEKIHVVENLVGHFNDRGELYEIMGYAFDNTERKRAEEALKESEANLARAQSISRLANWEVDVGTDKVRGSDELYRIFNLEADFTLAAYVEKFHPDDRDYVVESIHAALYEGKPYSIDYRIIPRTDDIRHVHAEGEVTHDEAGLPIKFFGIIQDITERKKVASEAEEGKRILDAIMEYIPEGITIADHPDVSIRMISRYGLQLMGRFPAMTAGIPMEEFRQAAEILRPDGKTRYLDEELPLSRAIRKGEVVVEEEMVLARPDGVMIPLLCNAGPIKDRAGSIIGGILAWRDITRIKEAQKELESFTYSVSHDLRAPLRAISGFTRMILDTTGAAFDQETSRKFGIIQQNAEKMGQLIDDLLKLSRLSRVELRRSGIDMGRLVREVVEELRMAEPEQKLKVAFHELPPAHGDTTLVRQLMVNLLSNAAKFTRQEEEPRVEIGSLERTDERIYYVMDNGVGFDMKYYGKLFGPFQRLVSEKEFEGTGVGLAIARRVVQRHGGRIWAEGKPRGGATFYFTLSGKQK